EVKMPVILEKPKVAVSFGPLGTVAGVQLGAVFQSPFVGLRFHVALPAKAVLAARTRNGSNSAARMEAGALIRRCKGIISLISLPRNELQRLCLILITMTSKLCEGAVRSQFTLRKEREVLGSRRLADLAHLRIGSRLADFYYNKSITGTRSRLSNTALQAARMCENR